MATRRFFKWLPEAIQRRVLFLLVGIFNTALGYSVFVIICLLIGIPTLAIVIATALGILLGHTAPLIEAYGVALVINVVLLKLLFSLKMDALLAQVLCLVVVVSTSYLINARLVFRVRSRHPITEEGQLSHQVQPAGATSSTRTSAN